jgi:hypothetical protein
MTDMPENYLIAVDTFIKKIVSDVYNGAINGIRKVLEKGPSGRTKQVKQSEMFEWYQMLSERDRQVLAEIIEESVKLSIYLFLVELDNKVGGPPIRDQSSDFALYLQTYESDKEKYNYSPNMCTQINLSYTAGGDLHEIFINRLQTRDIG